MQTAEKKISANAFLSSVASVLEMDEVRQDFAFRNAPGWCSLQAFGLLVLLENDWGAPVSLDRFEKLETVRDLYREAFIAFAARLLNVERETMRGASYGSIPEWDSVNHLRLVMEAEQRFGVVYPMERIPQMKTIDDFLIP